MERQAANGGRREGKSRRRRQRRSNRRLPSFQVSSAASVLPASPQVRLLSLSLSLVVQFCSWQGLLAQRSRGNSSGCIILPPATSYMETLAENILKHSKARTKLNSSAFSWLRRERIDTSIWPCRAYEGWFFRILMATISEVPRFQHLTTWPKVPRPKNSRTCKRESGV